MVPAQSHLLHIRKRRRACLTCTNCRFRKVKCDQNKPCSACTKRGIPPELCVYEQPAPGANSGEGDSKRTSGRSELLESDQRTMVLLLNENSKLKRELDALKAQLEGKDDEPVDKKKRLQVMIPDSLVVKTDRLAYYGPTSWRSIILNYGKDTEIAESAVAYLSNIRREWKIKMNLKSISPKEYEDMETAYPDVLLRNLSNYLPEFDVVKQYLDIYGQSFWNQCIPVLDHNVLMRDFLKLFTKDPTTNKCVISVYTKNADYAKIALVLAVVKYVVLTLNLSSDSDHFSDRDQLIRYARSFLRFGRYESRATLPALQALILIHTLMPLDPMDGDGDGATSSAMSLKNAVNMALAMGLHRDVDRLFSVKSVTYRATLKKLWRFLYFRDTYVSLHLGLPLTIDDDVVHENSFGQASDEYEAQLVLMKIIRRACKLCTKTEAVYKDEFLALIDELQSFDNGVLLRMSEVLRSWNSLPTLMNNQIEFGGLLLRLSGLNVLHMLWEVLSEYCDPDDTDRYIYSVGCMKFCTLSFFQNVEFMWNLNNITQKLAEANNQNDVHRLVEISTTVMAMAKPVIYRCYASLFANEIKFFDTPPLSDLLFRRISMEAVERLDPWDKNNPLVQSITSSGYSNQILALVCKSLLHIRNESRFRVFNFSFTLYCLLAGYKFFQDIIAKRRSSGSTSQDTSPASTVVSDVQRKQCSPQQRQQTVSPLQHQQQHDQTVPPPPLQQQQQQQQGPIVGRTPLQEFMYSGSSSASSQPLNGYQPIPGNVVYDSANKIDLFEWRNDAVDELFRELLEKDELIDMFQDGSIYNA